MAQRTHLQPILPCAVYWQSLEDSRKLLVYWFLDSPLTMRTYRTKAVDFVVCAKPKRESIGTAPTTCRCNRRWPMFMTRNVQLYDATERRWQFVPAATPGTNSRDSSVEPCALLHSQACALLPAHAHAHAYAVAAPKRRMALNIAATAWLQHVKSALHSAAAGLL